VSAPEAEHRPKTEGSVPRYDRGMFIPAFSTVSCPEWPLDVVARRARQMGYSGVELRTFGEGSTGFASDPALTAPEKVRRVLRGEGVRAVSLGTSVCFDAPVRPPIIGWALTDTEASVRAACSAVDLAISIESPLVRVFGYQIPGGERPTSAIARIVDRLRKVVDHADRTGVRVMVENAGSFPRAGDVADLVDRVGGPLVGVCYNVANAALAGEDPAEGLRSLGARVLAVRVKDLQDGRPVRLGQGRVPVRAVLQRAAESGFDGPVIYELDRAWLGSPEDPEPVLRHALQFMFEAAAASGVRPGAGADGTAGTPGGLATASV
jgi:sugar phosphate isomerase/epimerase